MWVPSEPSSPLFLEVELDQITGFKSPSLEKKEYGFFGRRIQGVYLQNSSSSSSSSSESGAMMRELMVGWKGGMASVCQ